MKNCNIKSVIRHRESTFGKVGFIDGWINTELQCNGTFYTIFIRNSITLVDAHFEQMEENFTTFRYGTNVTSDQVESEPVLKLSILRVMDSKTEFDPVYDFGKGNAGLRLKPIYPDSALNFILENYQMDKTSGETNLTEVVRVYSVAYFKLSANSASQRSIRHVMPKDIPLRR